MVSKFPFLPQDDYQSLIFSLVDFFFLQKSEFFYAWCVVVGWKAKAAICTCIIKRLHFGARFWDKARAGGVGQAKVTHKMCISLKFLRITLSFVSLETYKPSYIPAVYDMYQEQYADPESVR